ncbi:uncharacterized protein LOC114532610 [Dendronephthya gigantea]|uniref:uncharacterized protein LOC114532610 n=1 Tax=Dendronephthya gigantea TaxID=151771 RepID=UPI001069E1B7|nr:uncharacterized protein LOC114532610 [Dendronephthya gigantea]
MEPVDEVEAACEEVDPNKLISKNGVLGYERTNGFEEITNFDVKVDGYVGDGEGSVIGYIIRIILAVRDPFISADNDRSSRQFFLTNRQLGNNTTIVNCLTAKFPPLWIAQSKDMFLPQFVYSLCKEYMKTPSEEIKSFKPVEIVGKQKTDDVWVFNPHVHVDKNGRLIPQDERAYVSMEASSLPYLRNISSDLDDGAAFKRLLVTEKALFQNNYPQVVLAHAGSSMACNYDLILKKFDGCAIPVLMGPSVSGKTTALKAVMSIFGIRKFTCESSSRYIENRQSNTTIPFGWDDASDMKVLKNVSVNSFNGCGSSTMKNTLQPHTVPVVSTNLDTSEKKINSRWLRIEFKALSPRLTGKDKVLAEMNVKAAMNEAHKSICVVTTCMHNNLEECTENDTYFTILEELEEEIEKKGMQIDDRVKLMMGLLLFSAKKILEKVDLADDYVLVWETMKEVILPGYTLRESEQQPTSNEKCQNNANVIHKLLHDHLLPLAAKEDPNYVMRFIDNDHNPSKCTCGKSVVFHVKDVVEFLRKKASVTGDQLLSSVTENSVRRFIKSRDIGCVGVQVRFRRRPKQCNAAHIQRIWFDPNDLSVLDEKLGKRNDKSGTKVQTILDNDSVLTNVETILDNDSVLPNTQTILDNDSVLTNVETILDNDSVLPNAQTILDNDSVLTNVETILDNDSVLTNTRTILDNDSVLQM